MTENSSVCDYCLANVLLPNKPYGQHQPNEETWSLSVSQGCPFCLVLRNDIFKARTSFPGVRSLDAVKYRWTIRPTGKIRESQEYIIITFRPLITNHVPGDAEAAGKLTERVFFLLPEDGMVASLHPNAAITTSNTTQISGVCPQQQS